MFESTDKKYWLVKKDDDFFNARLFKLGMSLIEIEEYRYIKLDRRRPNIVFISSDHTIASKSYFDEHKLKYMGVVKLTDEDIKKAYRKLSIAI